MIDIHNKKSRKHVRRMYTKKNYMNENGMMTSVWGPAFWHVLHTMSFNYPINPTTDDKHYYKTFLQTLVHILPCKYCRNNLKTNFKKMPLTSSDLYSRDAFSKYIYELHEMVNKMLGKQSGLTYCDVRERFENFRARCSNSKNKSTETGCTEPLWVTKTKCVLHIVPKTKRVCTFKIDRECFVKKHNHAKTKTAKKTKK